MHVIFSCPHSIGKYNRYSTCRYGNWQLDGNKILPSTYELHPFSTHMNINKIFIQSSKKIYQNTDKFQNPYEPANTCKNNHIQL